MRAFEIRYNELSNLYESIYLYDDSTFKETYEQILKANKPAPCSQTYLIQTLRTLDLEPITEECVKITGNDITITTTDKSYTIRNYKKFEELKLNEHLTSNYPIIKNVINKENNIEIPKRKNKKIKISPENSKVIFGTGVATLAIITAIATNLVKSNTEKIKNEPKLNLSGIETVLTKTPNGLDPIAEPISCPIVEPISTPIAEPISISTSDSDDESNTLQEEDITHNTDEVSTDQIIVNGYNDIEPDNNYFIDLNYSYKNDEELIERVKDNYTDLTEEYGKRFGIDPKLLRAIIAQESSGGKDGQLCGINFGCWNEEPAFKVYDYENKEYVIVELTNNPNKTSANETLINKQKTIVLNSKDIENPKCSIAFTAIILAKNYEYYNHNLTLTLLSYNMGYKNIEKILNETTKNTGNDKNYYKNNQDDIDYLNYTYIIQGEHPSEKYSDSNYVENVLKNIEDPDGTLTMKYYDKENNNEVINSYTYSYQKTLTRS